MYETVTNRNNLELYYVAQRWLTANKAEIQ